MAKKLNWNDERFDVVRDALDRDRWGKVRTIKKADKVHTQLTRLVVELVAAGYLFKLKDYSEKVKLSEKQIRDRVKVQQLDAFKINEGRTAPLYIFHEDKKKIAKDARASKKSSAKGAKSNGPPDDPEGETEVEKYYRLRNEKLEQELLRKHKDIEDRFKEQLLEKIYEVLTGLTEAFRQCKLTNEQVELISKATEECFQQFERL